MKKIITILLLFMLTGCGVFSELNLGGVQDDESPYVEILYNGEVVEYFQLTDDLELEITFEKGQKVEYFYPADVDKDGNEVKRDEEHRGFNQIIVKDGNVDVIDADCPDQVCVHHDSINKDSWNPSIICAPNRIEVRIVGVSVDIDGVV